MHSNLAFGSRFSPYVGWMTEQSERSKHQPHAFFTGNLDRLGPLIIVAVNSCQTEILDCVTFRFFHQHLHDQSKSRKCTDLRQSMSFWRKIALLFTGKLSMLHLFSQRSWPLYLRRPSPQDQSWTLEIPQTRIVLSLTQMEHLPQQVSDVTKQSNKEVTKWQTKTYQTVSRVHCMMCLLSAFYIGHCCIRTEIIIIVYF